LLRDEREGWRQAGIDPIKVASRLWKATRGSGQRRSQRPALKNEDISASAKPQAETPLQDLPG
jgi:hypothetical protein